MRRVVRETRDSFPRMCGDGPPPRTPPALRRRFPPHVRGWTRVRPDPRVARGVSPACAGMDRYSISLRASDTGFPRMCGDGPLAARFDEYVDQFPPHVRGWTSARVGAPTMRSVSPACAGMDPSKARSARTAGRFPRMCGDGPRSPTWETRFASFPPHVRGWTRWNQPAARIDAVSPACAGMDRVFGAVRRLARRFPRMCGDGPYSL